MAPHWAAEVAREKQAGLVYFSVRSACTDVFLQNPECLLVGSEGQKRLRPSWESLTSPPQWVDFPTKVAYNKHMAPLVYQALYEMNASGSSTGERIFKVVNSCQVASRFCVEYFRERTTTGDSEPPLGWGHVVPLRLGLHYRVLATRRRPRSLAFHHRPALDGKIVG